MTFFALLYLPHWTLPELRLASDLRIDVFGLLSAIGVGLGALIGSRAALKYAPGEVALLRDALPWMVVPGLIGGHLAHLFLYHPEELSLLSLLQFWNGLSSMGGVLGGVAGTLFFFHRKKKPVTPYLDAIALGLAPGWAVARVGCFLVHDHPGVLTTFPLAVDFPAAQFGGPRHDLGLYDAVVLLGITVVLNLAARRRPAQGRLMGLLAVIYAPFRFYFDTLRATDLSYVDKRYLGLTPAQYIVVALFVAGLVLLTRKAPATCPPPKA